MYWHQNLNATIGYSNPIKLTFGTACNIIVEKIFAENRIRYAQRGDYACLDQRGRSTYPRGIEVEPRRLDLTKHNAREATIKHLTFSKCNAQTHDGMII